MQRCLQKLSEFPCALLSILVVFYMCNVISKLDNHRSGNNEVLSPLASFLKFCFIVFCFLWG